MSSIEISTTQNVTIEYQFASLGERILAFFIDLIILLILSIFWNFFVTMLTGDAVDEDHFLSLFVRTFVPLIGYFLYFLLSEGISGQTIGKKITNIKVIRLDGEERSEERRVGKEC